MASCIDRLVRDAVLKEPLVYVQMLLLTPIVVILGKGLAPILMGKLIDWANGKSTETSPKRLIVTLSLVLLTMYVFSSANYIAMMRTRTNLVSNIRNELFAKVVPGYRHNFHNDTVGDTLIKLYKIPQAADNAYTYTRDMITSIATTLIITGIVFSINWRVGCLFAGVTLCLLAFGAGLFLTCLSKCHISDQSQDRLHEDASEILNNLTTLYITDSTSQRQLDLQESQNGFASKYTKCWGCSAAYKLGFGFVFVLFMIAAITLSINQYQKGVLTSGSVVAILLIISKLYGPLTQTMHTLLKFNMIYTRLQTSNVLLEKVETLTDHNQRVSVTLSTPPRILFQSVVARFVTGVEVRLPDVDIPFRQHVLISGIIGSGKSTFARVLLGMHVYEGSATVGGSEISRMDSASIHRLVGYTPQSPSLLRGSVWDNIVLGQEGQIDRAQIQEQIRRLGIPFPELDKDVGKGGSELSGGQKYIVSLLRSTLSKAPIMILDEPTGSFDAVNGEKVINYINGISNKTVVVISHHDNRKLRFDQSIVFDGELE